VGVHITHLLPINNVSDHVRRAAYGKSRRKLPTSDPEEKAGRTWRRRRRTIKTVGRLRGTVTCAPRASLDWELSMNLGSSQKRVIHPSTRVAARTRTTSAQYCASECPFDDFQRFRPGTAAACGAEAGTRTRGAVPDRRPTRSFTSRRSTETSSVSLFTLWSSWVNDMG